MQFAHHFMLQDVPESILKRGTKALFKEIPKINPHKIHPSLLVFVLNVNTLDMRNLKIMHTWLTLSCKAECSAFSKKSPFLQRFIKKLSLKH